MIQEDVFLMVVKTLEKLRVNYCIGGSVASITYSEPRLTRDMDVVIALRPVLAQSFANTFAAKGFYCPPVETILAEIRRGGMFNLYHHDTGVKVDCICLGREEHSLEEFRRRHKLPFSRTQHPAYFARPEDVIIKKLQYFRQGGSEKHLGDIRAMLRVSGDEMDMAYLKGWVKELKLEAEWKKVKESK